MKILSDYVLSNIDDLSHKFQTAQPFRHVLIHPFFEPSVCEEMVRTFPKPEPEKMLNEFGGRSRKMVRRDVRNLGPVYQKVDDYIKSQDFAHVMERITVIPNLLYDLEYFGGGTHDNHSGQGMDPHVDFNYHPTTGYHRRINAIIYLNEEWDEAWGGCLEVHKNPWDPENDWTVRYPPYMNHCILFETNEISWHGFEPVNLPEGKEVSRKSFAIYMYTKDRPGAEMADEHSTVYVQRPLPKHMVPGYVLTKDDIRDLRANFAKRNSMLKGLYDREKRLNGTIRALQEAKESLRIPTLGYVRCRPNPKGLLSNQGVGYQLKAEFSTQKPVNRITLRGRIPDFVGPNELTIRVRDREFVEKIEGDHFKLNMDINIPARTEFLLEINARKALSPKEAGRGPDVREFSFFLDEIVFEHSSQAGSEG